MNGTQESILYSFALPGHKIYKEKRIKLFKRINKSVLSHITYYLEDDDQKPVEFIKETTSFTCQLIKRYYLYLYTYKNKNNLHSNKLNYSYESYIQGIRTIICVFTITPLLNELKYDST